MAARSTVAEIDPGPEIIGIASGKTAIFGGPHRRAASARPFPVPSLALNTIWKPITKRSRPPATSKAGIVTPKNARIESPRIAKAIRMTPAMITARSAMAALVLDPVTTGDRNEDRHEADRIGRHEERREGVEEIVGHALSASAVAPAQRWQAGAGPASRHLKNAGPDRGQLRPKTRRERGVWRHSSPGVSLLRSVENLHEEVHFP